MIKIHCGKPAPRREKSSTKAGEPKWMYCGLAASRDTRGPPARGADNAWNIEDQPPELWDQYKTEFAPGTHVRIHPLLDWTELNIWEYIEAEGIPVVPLYYDQGTGTRYRSLGCGPCTKSIESRSSTASEIVVELSRGNLAHIAERSGRAQDKDDGGGLETLRRDGYM